MKHILPLLLCLSLLPLAAPAHAYEKGEQVEFTGMVTDRDGTPLADVYVVLEATRRKFDFRKFRKVTEDTFRLNTRTDGNGNYTVKWSWDDFHNYFRLRFGVPVREDGKDILHQLHEIDVTDRTKGSGPVVTPVVLEDTTFLHSLRRFQERLDTDDERRIYNEVGHPGKIEINPGNGFEEETWWYFELGRAYRFRDGMLQKTETFAPVRDFSG